MSIQTYNAFQQRKVVVVIERGAMQRPNVLGKAAASVADARKQEAPPNAVVGTDGPANVIDVGAQFFGQVGDLIHKAYLESQEGIGSVFGEFGGVFIHEVYGVFVVGEGVIQLAHNFPGPLRAGADNYAVGSVEVFDGKALAQELGIGNYVELDAGVGGNPFPDLSGGAYRHGTFVDDNRVVLEER